MNLWLKIVRAAALALLLIAACDVLVVDTAFASACNSNATSPASTHTPLPARETMTAIAVAPTSS